MDLISRQAAIEAVMNHYRVGDKSQNEEMDWCAKMLSGLPSAEPSVVTMKLEVDKESLRKAMQDAELTFMPAEKRGKWIVVDGQVVCSECYNANIETNYCPNCGARMEESE